jgi:hypothetical protein
MKNFQRKFLILRATVRDDGILHDRFSRLDTKLKKLDFSVEILHTHKSDSPFNKSIPTHFLVEEVSHLPWSESFIY